VQPSKLVLNALPAIRLSGQAGPVLDLACGKGRNGIYLVNRGQSVVFADRQQAALDEIVRELRGNELANFWNVDLEAPGCNPLAGHSFSTILIFRYLHRPLMAAIKDAVKPGGLVVYETYTVDQPRFGRPCSPDFLLRAGELEETFCNWETVYSFEGVTLSESSGREQAIARIVARKPRG
jgi:SAM-dependent methyltransferase